MTIATHVHGRREATAGSDGDDSGVASGGDGRAAGADDAGGEVVVHATHFSATHSTAIMESLRCLQDGQARLEAQLSRIEGLCLCGEGSTAYSNPLSSTNDGATTRCEHGASPALTQGDPPQLPEDPEILRQNAVLQALQESSSSMKDELHQLETEQKVAFMNRHHKQLLAEQEGARQVLLHARNTAMGWSLDTPKVPIEHDAGADAHARQVGGIKAWLNELIANGQFDAVFGLAIMVNAMLSFLRLEYRGQEIGYEYGFTHIGVLDHVKAEAPLAHLNGIFFDVADFVLLSLFTIEILVRIAIRYRTFFKHAWNYFDLLLVTSSYFELGFKFTNSTFLRVCRLSRLTRALRVARVMRSFEPLRILMATAVQSMLSLFWAIIMIGLILLLAACAGCGFIQRELEDDSLDFEVRQEIWRKFGTAGHAYYTFFRWTITTSWTSDVELLILGVNKYYGFVVFPFIIMVNFALIRVVSALFIRDTFAAAHKDNLTVLEETMKHDNDVLKKLKEIFTAFDGDGDGLMTKAEFDKAVIDPRFQYYLRSLEVEPFLAQSLFVLLDHGMGRISVEELIAGAIDLRQQAIGKGVDLCTVKYENQKSMLVVRNIEQQCSMIIKYMEYTMKHMCAVTELHQAVHEKMSTVHEPHLQNALLKPPPCTEI